MPILRALLVILTLVAMPGAASAQGEPGYLADKALLARALRTLREQVGAAVPVMSLKVEPRRIVIQVRGAHRATHMEEWTITLVDLRVTTRDRVSGPRDARAPTHVRDAAGGYFRLTEVDLDALPRLFEEAVARAALEDRAAVTRAVVERGFRLLPEPAWADVRWSIIVASRYESATIRADPAGRITGADLSQTNRARNLDLLSRDDETLPRAQAALVAAIGRGPVVRALRIRPAEVSVVAQLPSATPGLDDLAWTPSGLRKAALPGFADFARQVRSENRDPPFSLAELDLSAVPAVKAGARSAVGRPGARITEIEAKAGAGGEIRWIVTFDGMSAQPTRVETSASGAVRRVETSQTPRL